MSSQELLWKKGTIPVLVELSRGSRAIVELADLSIVTRNTVRRRLIEMERAGWAKEVTQNEEDDGRQRVYDLTPRGEALATFLDEIGTTELVERRRDTAREYERHVENIRGNNHPFEVAPEL